MAQTPASPHEAAACALCGGLAFGTLGPLDDRLGLCPGPWPWGRCLACGHEQLSLFPQAEALAAAYPSSYWHKASGAGGWASRLAQGYRRWLLAEDVARFLRLGLPRGARVLDVGSGSGELLAALVAAGFQAEGVELSALAQAQASAQGLRVHAGELAQAPAGPFDAIAFWHVLEHLPQPVEALREAAKRLAPQGLLILQVPNVRSWQAQAFGPRWLALDAPRHLHHFHPASLAQALEQAGFAPLAWSHLSLRSAPVALACSLLPQWHPHALARKAPGPGRVWGEAALLLATWLAMPLVLLEAWAGAGASLTVCARLKPPKAPEAPWEAT